MKFGQMLSTRRDLLPRDIADELEKLQDRVPPFSGAEARAHRRARLRASAQRRCSRSFDEQPLAAATIAQVHAAQLPDGKEVVVKIVRPGIRALIERDLEVLYALARAGEPLLARRAPAAPGRAGARVREDDSR